MRPFLNFESTSKPKLRDEHLPSDDPATPTLSAITLYFL